MKNPLMKVDKAEKYDFLEYQYSKQVIEDFPPLILIFKKLLPVLYEKMHYTAVWHVLQAVEESKTMLEIQYDWYQHVYETKGKINEPK